MSGKLFDRYGAILQEDVEGLEMALSELIFPKTLCGDTIRVCEIGMHDGNTARGIQNFIQGAGRKLTYWGIDPDPGTSRPRYIPEGATVIVGDSAEVFNQVPDGMDLIWVDGCHCFNHVVIETLHYSRKVRPGGFLCFHDTNPSGQGKGYQYHGPNIPEFGIDVNHALEAIKFPWSPWTLVYDKSPTDVPDCGTRIYRNGA